jgi:quercetin dioxygenase-like cupin family protein
MARKATTRVQLVLACSLLALGACERAPEPAAGPGPGVVPAAERELAAKKGMAGPTANRSVRSVTLRGTVELGSEFPSMQGRQLRAREIVIEPGGVIAVHEHHARPGLAYILEGEVVEHRNDHPEPILHKPGGIAFEWTGVVHWWENRSDRPVRALVVDIVPVE